MQGFRFICVVGNSGSGKTSLLVSLLTDRNILKKCFNNVVVAIPETSRRSMKKDPFEDLDPAKQFENLQEIERIYDMLNFYSSENETTLLLIDDCQADLKDTYIANVLNKIKANRRHLKTTIIILLQTFNKLPLSSRKLLNLLITFRPSKKEWNSISELIEYDQDITNNIFKLCFPMEDTDKHHWVLLDIQHQKFDFINNLTKF